MEFEDLLEKSFLIKASVNFKQIRNFLARARKDFSAARRSLQIDEEWAFAIAYNAMLRAARALLLSMGYRPKGKDHHRTLVIITERTLGIQNRDLTRNFDRMRRKRHEFIYEPNQPIPRLEAEAALDTAQEFLQKIENHVGERDPQRKIKV